MKRNRVIVAGLCVVAGLAGALLWTRQVSPSADGEALALRRNLNPWTRSSASPSSASNSSLTSRSTSGSSSASSVMLDAPPRQQKDSTLKQESSLKQVAAPWHPPLAPRLTPRAELIRILPPHIYKALGAGDRNTLTTLIAQARRGEPIPHFIFPAGTPPEVAQSYDIVSRVGTRFRLLNYWTQTATNGTVGRGDPITLTWSLVPDGTPTPRVGSTTGEILPSDLQARFNAIYGDTNCETLRRLIRQCFARWEAVTGIHFEEVNYDDMATVASAPGVLGVRADMRFAGVDFAPTAALAVNYTPSNSDTIIDTSLTYWNNTNNNSTNDYVDTQNGLAHEIGHGLGLNHACTYSGEPSKLMAFFANGQIGPRFDDALGVQRFHGDHYEFPNGNDTTTEATPVGTRAPGNFLSDSIPPGISAPNTLSIDGANDVDVFEFYVDAVGRSVSAALAPNGNAYKEGTPNDCAAETTFTFDPRTQSNLVLELLDSSGNVMAYRDNTAAGSNETISAVGLSGTGPYYVRVSSSGNDAAQPYRFSLSTTTRSEAAPEVSVSLAPSPALIDSTLTATVTATDPNGGTPTLTYTWLHNNTVIPDQNSATLDLTQVPGLTYSDVIRVNVTASDGTEPAAQASDSVVIVEGDSLHVTSVADTISQDGFTTLREAFNYANSLGGTQTITFKADLNGTILLTTQLPTLSGTLNSLTISGPGKTQVSISGQNSDNIMELPTGKTLSVSGLTFTNGRSQDGGLFKLDATIFSATDCDFTSSLANGWGGAIYGSGINTLSLTRCVFISNVANSTGGAIFLNNGAGSAALESCSFSSNTSAGDGGAFYLLGSSLTINASSFSGNSGSGNGGAIYTTSGTVTAATSSFEGNSSGTNGGVFYFTGAASNFADCTFANNQAGTATGSTGNGGVIRDSTGALTMRNCTLVANTCDGLGGALYDFGADSRIVNCTFSGNNAPTGSSWYFVQSNHVILNTILDAPAGAPASIARQIGGVSGSSTNNLASDSAGGLLPTVASNKINTPAGLAALANNGGPVKTMALQAGSAALNAGYDSTQAPDSLLYDARGSGFSRKIGLVVDMGAFEGQQGALNMTNDVADVEGDTGTKNYVFNVSLSEPSAQTVSVDYATANGSATAGSDFGSASDSDGGTPGTLTFAPGETTGSITLPVNGDTDFEANETFFVNLSNPTNAVISEGQSLGTINNDDTEAPSLIVTTTSEAVTNADGLTSLREALTYANSNPNGATPDAITFAIPDAMKASGIWTIQLTSALPNVSDNVTITGPSANLLTVRGNGTTTTSFIPFTVDSGKSATFSGLTISNGYRGIDNNGTATLTNCSLSGNNAGMLNDGTATLTSCNVSNNFNAGTTDVHGHNIGIFNNGTVELTNCTLNANLNAENTVSNGSTTTNTGSNIGILNNINGTATLNNCILSSNKYGVVNHFGLTATLHNCTISDSTETGIVNRGSTLTTATKTTLTLTGSTLSSNTSNGLLNSGLQADATVINCTFNGASSSSATFNSGTLTLTNSTLAGCTRGLSNSGNATLTNCTISGNTTGVGRGVDNSEVVTLTNCTISGNITGLRNTDTVSNGTATLTNCTVSGNTTGVGVGIENAEPLTLTNCTISGNTTGLNNTNTATLKNTLCVGNSTANITNTATVTDGGGNLTTGTATDAGLDPAGLKDNGGPTKTIALVTGSPAINTGNNSLIPAGITTDQRGTGFPRIISGTVDKGAYEVQSIPLPPQLAITNPLHGSTYTTSSLTQATGTASDGDGIASVRVQLYRYALYGNSAGYWNGTSFDATYNATLHDRLATTTNSFSTWSTGLPTLTTGQYALVATAHDNVGNWTQRTHVFYIKDNPPQLAITNPLHGSTYTTSSLTQATGTASDGDGIASVRVQLYRYALYGNSAGYWNGTSFDATYNATLHDRLATTTNSFSTWSTGLPTLTTGQYALVATAHDNVGNWTQRTHVFYVNDALGVVIKGNRVGATQSAVQQVVQAVNSDLIYGSALSSSSTIVLKFGRAMPASSFGVTVNKKVKTVSDTLRMGQTVTLLLPTGSLQVGDQVVVIWNGGKFMATVE